jgi:hypothetical protein
MKYKSMYIFGIHTSKFEYSQKLENIVLAIKIYNRSCFKSLKVISACYLGNRDLQPSALKKERYSGEEVYFYVNLSCKT